MRPHRILALLACALGVTLFTSACALRSDMPKANMRPANTQATIYVDRHGKILEVEDATGNPIPNADKKPLRNQDVKFSNDSGDDRVETILIFFRQSHRRCTAVSGGNTFTYPCH
jgi:hypothetical protein